MTSGLALSRVEGTRSGSVDCGVAAGRERLDAIDLGYKLSEQGLLAAYRRGFGNIRFIAKVLKVQASHASMD